jgi:hypothetical protein
VDGEDPHQLAPGVARRPEHPDVHCPFLQARATPGQNKKPTGASGSSGSVDPVRCTKD